MVISADNLQVTDEPQRRVGGDGETKLEIVLPSLVFRAGETITGTIILTPQKDMSDARARGLLGLRDAFSSAGENTRGARWIQVGRQAEARQGDSAALRRSRCRCRSRFLFRRMLLRRARRCTRP